MDSDYTLIEEHGSWMRYRGDQETLVEQLQRADGIIADIDDCDVRSLARKFIIRATLNPNYLTNPKFINWLKTSGQRWLSEGKEVESECGKSLIADVLDDSLRRKIRRISGKQKVKFFKGIREFYAALPEGITRVYVTRNIEELVYPVVEKLSIDLALFEQFEKEGSIAEILSQKPDLRRVIVKGDSDEDVAMVHALNKFRIEDRLDEVTSIYVANNRRDTHPGFDPDIITGKNHHALARFIQQGL
tara:strand:+ start:218 stop:955 length:738 start_codon:yes stop_codon:yes gene_type:complete